MSDAEPWSDNDRIGAEAVRTVFRTVTFAVLAAALGSLMLAGSMAYLGYATPLAGAIFASYVWICALLHIALSRAYHRRAHLTADWQVWGRAFTMLCLLEGSGWGWAPVGLINGAPFEAEMLCLLVNLGMVGGSLPAFSPFLPAFLAFFIPSIVPFAIHNAMYFQPLREVTTTLVFLYVGGIGTFGVLFNRSFSRQIALRIRAEGLADDLKVQVAIAEAANRSKSTFLAAASHDLRQPVHALSLFVGALRGLPMSPDATQIIQHIERSTLALDELFVALLDISKLDAGIVEAERRAFQIGPMLERICHDTEDVAREKGLRINVRHPHQAIAVDSDPVLVERIVRNLVTNAVRYTRQGRVLVACRLRGPRVRIEVWDTGPGIPPSEREAIFEEYYQLGNPERDRSKGLGLGLAIVRRLTRLLESDLTLRSAVGRGSMFALTVAKAERVLAPVEVPVELVAESLHQHLVVVIDDEAEIRRGMSAVLERWGHYVIAAASGAEALELLADHPTTPDLILADFRLRSNESGIDAIESLRSEYNLKIPAILITGDTAPERLVEARESGLLLLHKPVSNSRLRAAIANTMLVDAA